MPECAHSQLALRDGQLFCDVCDLRIDDDMGPSPGDPRADLKMVHEIDQAHASAEARMDALVERFRAWRQENPTAPAEEATRNPMAFYAIVQLGQTKIDMNDLPYLLAAAIMRIAHHELTAE